MIGRPKVSIICSTSNDEGGIRRTLESLLAQRTNFPIEILIHDNASTDSTPAIIDKYATNYPEVIRAFYEETRIEQDTLQLNVARARGKYIAVCNGNAVWTDEYKLQRQHDYLEQTKHCVLSMHACRMEEDGAEDVVCAPSKMNRFYGTEELLCQDSGFYAESSIFFLANLVKNRPALFSQAPAPDMALLLYLSLFGQVHYMREVMSVERRKSESAEVDSVAMGEWLLKFDQWTNYTFRDEVKERLATFGMEYAVQEIESRELESVTFKELFGGTVPIKNRVGLLFQKYFPEFADLLKRRQWLMYKLLHRR